MLIKKREEINLKMIYLRMSLQRLIKGKIGQLDRILIRANFVIACSQKPNSSAVTFPRHIQAKVESTIKRFSDTKRDKVTVTFFKQPKIFLKTSILK